MTQKIFEHTWTYSIPLIQGAFFGALMSIDWSPWGLYFDKASYLQWLFVIPVLQLVFIGYFHWKARVTHKLGDTALIRAMSASHSNAKQVIKGVFFLAAMTCFILALARPQWGQTDQVIKRSGIDVVFALDLSKSMLARDVAPNRLQAAKEEIRTTLEMLKGDRAGLVVFTAVSFAQSPLTSDYGALRFYLRKLKPEQMPFGGTSIGRALHDSAELLTGKKQQNTFDPKTEGKGTITTSTKMKRAKTQLIVLITDGEDHESDPINAAKAVKAQGIHVVTVGFGSAKGERIPIYKKDGTVSGYQRNKKGEFVYTRLDEKMMTHIASETKGIFLPYKGQNSIANGLINYINALEKSELQSLMRKRYKERFMWFLIPGLCFLLISLTLSERKKHGRPAMFVGLIFAMLFTFGCEDAFKHEHRSVALGNEAIENKKFGDALKHYREAEKQMPATSQLHYNLGRAHFGLTQWDKAQEYFARALETQDDTLRFKALYNLGLTLAKKKSWTEAYNTLKQAIGLYAELTSKTKEVVNIHKDAVHNLEVVYNKMYPPCHTFEDKHEENDAPSQAKAFGKDGFKDLALCGGDDDWFQIPVLVGTQVEIKVTFKHLRDVPDPEHVFLPKPEDLHISLFDSTGKRALMVDQGKDQKPIGSKNPTVVRHLKQFTVTKDMLSEGKQALLFKLSAFDTLEFQYNVEITSIPPCSSVDDQYEENNSRAQAKKLKPGAEQLHLCARDEDWFTVTLELGDTLFVDVQPRQDDEKKEPTKLSFEIRDARRNKVIARGRPESGLLTAGIWTTTQPGDYHIRIWGEDETQEGQYALQTYVYAPCPLGDDRNEDNDSADRASMLNPQMPMHRYLRLCPEDTDFYKLPMAPIESKDKKKAADKKDDSAQKLALGLSVVTQKKARKTLETLLNDPEALSFSLMSQNGDQIKKESVNMPPILEEKRKKGTKAKKDTSIPLHKMLQADKIETPNAIIRVQGQEMFYHIVQLNPQSKKDDKQKQKDKQKDKQDDKKKDGKPEDQKDDNKSPEQDQNKDKKDKGDENSKEDEKKDDEKGKDDKSKDPKQEPGDKDKAQKKEQEDKQGKSKDKPEDQKDEKAGMKKGKKDPEMQRINDILRALEETDDNFQMRKALENTPGRYIEKDW